MKDTNSLSHTTWNCKYHIVFALKYRRQVIYGKIKSDIGKILRKLCEWKGVEIIEVEAYVDHIHMLVAIPPKISVSSFGVIKEDMGFRRFLCKGQNNVLAESILLAMSYNINKLHNKIKVY